MSKDKLVELKEKAVEAETTVEGLKSEIASIEGAEEVDKELLKSKKAELRKASSAMKKANTAISKEEKRLEAAAEREAKKAEREAAKQKKAEEREAKAKAKAEEKARKAAEREANRMPEQNGIRRPKPNTKCGRTWAIADELSEKFQQPTPIKELLEACEAEGLNPGNVKAEYARWRKFYNITGRISLPKVEAETATE